MVLIPLQSYKIEAPIYLLNEVPQRIQYGKGVLRGPGATLKVCQQMVQTAFVDRPLPVYTKIDPEHNYVEALWWYQKRKKLSTIANHINLIHKKGCLRVSRLSIGSYKLPLWPVHAHLESSGHQKACHSSGKTNHDDLFARVSANGALFMPIRQACC